MPTIHQKHWKYFGHRLRLLQGHHLQEYNQINFKIISPSCTWWQFTRRKTAEQWNRNKTSFCPQLALWVHVSRLRRFLSTFFSPSPLYRGTDTRHGRGHVKETLLLTRTLLFCSTREETSHPRAFRESPPCLILLECQDDKETNLWELGLTFMATLHQTELRWWEHTATQAIKNLSATVKSFEKSFSVRPALL